MEPRRYIWIGMIIGGYAGGLVPMLWGAGGLTFSSLIFNAIGGLVGVWLGFQASRALG